MAKDPAGPLRVAVVDDEELARALLREYLAGIDGVEVVAECANGYEAVRAVNDLAPDLLLLDVQMPDLSGFDVLELVDHDVAVVFVTAYDEHAVHAFEVHAVDYLLKPFAAARLGEAIARARQRLGRPQPTLAAAARVAQPASAAMTRVLVREGPSVFVIPVDRLEVVEARDDYIALRAGGREYRKRHTLAEMEGRLDARRFVRVHRSFIVNVAHIARIERYAKDSRLAVLADGRKVPVSRAGFARLRSLLGTRVSER
jgi:two-component system LytT family response regulator